MIFVGFIHKTINVDVHCAIYLFVTLYFNLNPNSFPSLENVFLQPQKKRFEYLVQRPGSRIFLAHSRPPKPIAKTNQRFFFCQLLFVPARSKERARSLSSQRASDIITHFITVHVQMYEIRKHKSLKFSSGLRFFFVHFFFVVFLRAAGSPPHTQGNLWKCRNLQWSMNQMDMEYK